MLISLTGGQSGHGSRQYHTMPYSIGIDKQPNGHLYNHCYSHYHTYRPLQSPASSVISSRYQLRDRIRQQASLDSTVNELDVLGTKMPKRCYSTNAINFREFKPRLKRANTLSNLVKKVASNSAAIVDDIGNKMKKKSSLMKTRQLLDLDIKIPGTPVWSTKNILKFHTNHVSDMTNSRGAYEIELLTRTHIDICCAMRTPLLILVL